MNKIKSLLKFLFDTPKGFLIFSCVCLFLLWLVFEIGLWLIIFGGAV